MFKEARLKIERADHHIRDLADRISEFSRSDFYTLSPELQPSAGTIVKLRITREIPAEWALVIGDAAHNLRSSLDIVVGNMASNLNADFIFHETKENLIDAINKGPIKGLPEIIRTLIVDEIRPYKTGNYALWSLNKLNVLDKHKLVIPLVSLGNISGVHARYADGSVCEISIVARNGNFVCLSPGKFEIVDNGKATINTVFGTGTFFDGKPIVSTLVEISKNVSSVIDIFERTFPLTKASNS